MSTDPTLCPVCRQHYAMRCRCPRGDMVCPAGHEWPRAQHATLIAVAGFAGCLVHDRVVVGAADHAKGMDECSCKEVKR
jgi:hypothetical protein